MHYCLSIGQFVENQTTSAQFNYVAVYVSLYIAFFINAGRHISPTFRYIRHQLRFSAINAYNFAVRTRT